MTDKKKLEAIRAEIERFRKTNKVSEDKEYAQYELDVKCGYDMALDDMLSYINSLSEETVSEDFEKTFISMVNATHENNGSYSLHEYAQRLYNIAKEELKEPVSDDLEQAAEEYEEKGRIDAFVSRKRDFINGAKWQKQQDQSTIELAEDHAMLAGMEKMKEQMMKNAIDGYVIEDIEEGNGDFLLSAEYLPKSMGLKDQQRVKVIVIKEED